MGVVPVRRPTGAASLPGFTPPASLATTANHDGMPGGDRREAVGWPGQHRQPAVGQPALQPHRLRARCARLGGERGACPTARLDYRARTGLLVPLLQVAQGSGRHRRYSYRDVLALKVSRRLLDADVSLRRIRAAVEFLRRELDEDLVSATLVLNGSRSVLVHREGDLLDIVRHGQGVLSIVGLAPLRAEVDAAIATLAPTSPTTSPTPSPARQSPAA